MENFHSLGLQLILSLEYCYQDLLSLQISNPWSQGCTKLLGTLKSSLFFLLSNLIVGKYLGFGIVLQVFCFSKQCWFSDTELYIHGFTLGVVHKICRPGTKSGAKILGQVPQESPGTKSLSIFRKKKYQISCFKTSFPVLEHLFMFWTSFSVSEHPFFVLSHLFPVLESIFQVCPLLSRGTGQIVRIL